MKHAYFRCIDTCNVEEMEGLFLEDATVHYIGGFYEWKFDNRAEMLKAVKDSFNQEAIGHHNAHTPEIQILSETEATGIWYLHDKFVSLDDNINFEGTAIYQDKYVKQDGQWKIAYSEYDRLFEEITVRNEQMMITSIPVK